MEFEPGDVVKIKSGGEKMTVESVDGSLVDCVWFDNKQVMRGTFDSIVLKKYEPGGLVASRGYSS
ncbi:MAG: DUF2158 domain-containing protein [Sphingomonadaceae bacterium]|nr:DUF2158 domain-containing protein [Sphingomonadaceae bacterium]